MEKKKGNFIELTFYASNNKVLVNIDDVMAFVEHYEESAEKPYRNKIKVYDELGMNPIHGNVFHESYDEIKAALFQAGLLIKVPILNRKDQKIV